MEQQRYLTWEFHRRGEEVPYIGEERMSMMMGLQKGGETERQTG